MSPKEGVSTLIGFHQSTDGDKSGFEWVHSKLYSEKNVVRNFFESRRAVQLDARRINQHDSYCNALGRRLQLAFANCDVEYSDMVLWHTGMACSQTLHWRRVSPQKKKLAVSACAELYGCLLYVTYLDTDWFI